MAADVAPAGGPPASPRSTGASARQGAAIAMVRWARERVPLYRELYARAGPVERWSDFVRLPVLTAARLRATPLAEQVDTLDDVVRSQTAYRTVSAVPPRALVLDADDTDAVWEQVRAAFALAGVRRGMRLVFLAPPWQRYVAAEMADQLGYYRIEVHLVIAATAAAGASRLAALRPDRVVSFGLAPPPGAGWITVRSPRWDGADLYVVPEAGPVAVRAAGEGDYRVLRSFFLVEQRGGRLLLTALHRYHQPLIRHELPDRGVLRRGRLLLEYVAP